MFESTDPNTAWDVTNQDKKIVSPGTYYVLIDAIGLDDHVYDYSGTVTVVVK